MSGDHPIRRRLRVHRTIEALRSAGLPFDAMDVADEGLGALGVTAPEDPAELDLLEEEVRRLLDDELEGIAFGDPGPEDVIASPADPYGELEGTRAGVSRLIARRADEAVERGLG